MASLESPPVDTLKYLLNPVLGDIKDTVCTSKADASPSSKLGPFHPLLSPRTKTIEIAAFLMVIQMWTF